MFARRMITHRIIQNTKKNCYNLSKLLLLLISDNCCYQQQRTVSAESVYHTTHVVLLSYAGTRGLTHTWYRERSRSSTSQRHRAKLEQLTAVLLLQQQYHRVVGIKNICTAYEYVAGDVKQSQQQQQQQHEQHTATATAQQQQYGSGSTATAT